jgi:hypothetical protein
MKYDCWFDIICTFVLGFLIGGISIIIVNGQLSVDGVDALGPIPAVSRETAYDPVAAAVEAVSEDGSYNFEDLSKINGARRSLEILNLDYGFTIWDILAVYYVGIEEFKEANLTVYNLSEEIQEKIKTAKDRYDENLIQVAD